MNSEPELSEEMKNNMIHIESEEDYEAIDELRSMINGGSAMISNFLNFSATGYLLINLNLLKSSDPSALRKNMSLSLQVKKKAKKLNMITGCLKKRNIRSDG